MAIGRRGSRAIVVDGKRYRWTFSIDSGYSWLVVQLAAGTGRKLLVYGPTDLEPMPKLVTKMIEQAIALGWSPVNRGAEFCCDVLDGGVLKRR